MSPLRPAACFLLVLWTASLAAASEVAASDERSWPAQFGNHRAVVRVPERVEAVQAELPWRRPDHRPEERAIVVVDAATGKAIENVASVRVNRERGFVVFEPVTAPGDYYVYYLPIIPSRPGNASTDGVYAASGNAADKTWRDRAGLSKDGLAKVRWRKLPKAELVEFQSIGQFDQFVEMEEIATTTETQRLLDAYPRAMYLLFPEDRRHPIRMRDDVPRCWIERGPSGSFSGAASLGEFYTWQIGLFAARAAVADLDVRVGDFHPATCEGPSIPASAVRCFNVGGTDWHGKPFSKTVAVDRGKVQPLWFGVAIPKDLPPGRYEGVVTIVPKRLPPSDVRIELNVDEQVLDDHGDSEPWRHSRLRWLDSTLGLEDEPLSPYTPLRVERNTIHCLGRTLTVGAAGLPESAGSCFISKMTAIGDRCRGILAEPIRFVAEYPGGGKAVFVGRGATFGRQERGVVTWQAASAAGKMNLQCSARMEFDGHLDYRLQLTTREPVDLRDLRLEIPFRADVARFMMGLGRPGGLRPSRYYWKWDRAKHQDSLWVGDVNAGLWCRWFGENYARPFVGPHYAKRPLNLPPAWCNHGRGYVMLAEEKGGHVVLRAGGGPRLLHEDQTLHFNFHLLLTPFRPIETDKQWATRYHHQYRWPNHGDDDVRSIAREGANVLNIHQGNHLNPYINYPFLTVAPLTQFVRRAHDEGVRVKIYYTVRELTTRLPELWALRSLGDEVLAGGEGGGATWLREHLVNDYGPAWYDAPFRDASILTAGMSRWHNFYVEGLDWLLRNVEIDGLYLDEVAYDRTVMKRVRNVLDRRRPDGMIDLHSWNHFNSRGGFGCCADLYMEHLPYIDRIWFGESRDYNTPPDYWLVEISGIPFGLMGEMLQGGGNPWRGMLFGMTSRWGWNGGRGPCDPRPIWRLWDEFGMRGSRMIGHWVPACPVATDQKNVLVTVYRRPGKSLLALASWAPQEVKCRLKIDWAALGVDPSRARLRAPAVEGLQRAAAFRPNDAIAVEPGKGLWLILEEAGGN